MVLLLKPPRGISSNGRAPASHAGGTGIDTRILQERFFMRRKKNQTVLNKTLLFFDTGNGIGIGMFKFLTQLGKKTQVLMKNRLFYVSFPY